VPLEDHDTLGLIEGEAVTEGEGVPEGDAEALKDASAEALARADAEALPAALGDASPEGDGVSVCEADSVGVPEPPVGEPLRLNDADAQNVALPQRVGIADAVRHGVAVAQSEAGALCVAHAVAVAEVVCEPDPDDEWAMLLLGETVTITPLDAYCWDLALWEGAFIVRSSNGWDSEGEGELRFTSLIRATLRGELRSVFLNIDLGGALNHD
jgi:hypothetical protein